MIIDKKYCMSSFLMYRRIIDDKKNFSCSYPNKFPVLDLLRTSIHDSKELLQVLKKRVEFACNDGKAVLALSGGIDSAILAKFMPKGSTAYTFKCVVPGVEVTDESIVAAKYAEECGLNHKVIEVYWEDMEKYAPALMKHKGQPIHSIEVQIYKAAMVAKAEGFERVIYGESADCVFGGLGDILSKDWLLGDFIDRYAYVLPYKVLRNPQMILDPFYMHEINGNIDPHDFMATEFYLESVGSYANASAVAGMGLVVPYAECIMGIPIDYKRIRDGENKYLVREVFNNLYPRFTIPPKTPMPRPTKEWFKYWHGPTRKEFIPHCTDNLSGDQKWLVWALEKFLNIIDS